jgi:hypothetical protein
VALKEVLARFGFQVDDAGLKKGEKSIGGFTSKIQAAAAVVGGAAVIGGIRSFFNEMTGLEAQINDQSEALGLSAREFQQWGYAASQSGASAEVVSGAMLKMQQAAVESKGKFAAIGVELNGSDGKLKGTSELFREVGLSIGSIENPAERTAAIIDVFGRSGTKLQATFAGGAEGLDTMLARFDDLGGGVGPEALQVLSDAGDRAADMQLAVTGLKARLATALFPAFTTMIAHGSKMIGAFAKMAEGSKIFQAAAVVAAVAVGRAGMKMIVPYLPMIALLGALVLLVDDVLTTMDGGDSVISRFVDSLLGVGATSDIVKRVKKDWQSFTKELDKAPDLASKIKEGFSIVGASIVKFFAEDIGAAVDLFLSRNPEIADAALQWTNDMLAPFDAIAAAPGKVKAWGASVLTSLRAAGAEWLAWAKGIGMDVVAGIVSGMTGGLVKLDGATAEVGLRLKKGLRGPKGVDARSPSRMSAAVGDDVVDGPIVAFRKRLPELERAGELLGAAMIPPSPSRAVDVRQTNAITIQQYGVRDARQATRTGLLEGLGDGRRALLGAVG